MKKTVREMKNIIAGEAKNTIDKFKRRESFYNSCAVDSPPAENLVVLESKKRRYRRAIIEPETLNISQITDDESESDSVAAGTGILRTEKKKRIERYSENDEDPSHLLLKKRKATSCDHTANDDLNASVGSMLINEPKTGRELRTVFIGNLPVDFKKKRLIKILKQYGKVEKVWTRGAKPLSTLPKKVVLIKNKFHENHPPLMVHAVFETVHEAHSALQLNGELYDGNRLRVTMVQEKIFDSGKGVFVGNLPFEIKDDELFDFFLQCGQIANVRVVRDVKTGAGKGFGYVNFKFADSVELALNLDEEKLKGREIRVQRLLSLGKKKKMDKKKRESIRKIVNKNRGSCLLKKNNSVEATRNRLKQKKNKPKLIEFKKKILAQKLSKKSKKNPDIA